MIRMVGFPPPVSKPYHNWAGGMAAHGDEYFTCDDLDDPLVRGCDAFYQTNELKPKFMQESRMEQHGKYMIHILESKRPFIVSESAPFRHHPEYLRFGWWSYKWDLGDFNNRNVSRDRWEKFQEATGTSFKPWREGDGPIVIMGQKEGDSSLRRMYNAGYDSFYDWVYDQVLTIREHTDRPIVIRPHPRNLDRGLKNSQRRVLFKLQANDINTSNVTISENLTSGGNQGGEGLAADLKDAYCVVTYNSLSSIEAVQEGVPVFALDGGSMSHPVAHHDLSEINNLRYDIDLTEWQNRIAYTMWNKEEVSSGECWAHLKPAYFG